MSAALLGTVSIGAKQTISENLGTDFGAETTNADA
jgi:hypothetical protein